jgi:hypothetical protein
MASQHTEIEQSHVEESLSAWKVQSGQRVPLLDESSSHDRLSASHSQVAISSAGREKLAQEDIPRLLVPKPDTGTKTPADKDGAQVVAPQANAADEASFNQQLDNDPRLTLLRMAIESLTGHKVQMLGGEMRDPSKASSDVGAIYERHETRSEFEQTDFSARGKVSTADGREIGFSIQLSMSRAYVEQIDITVRYGSALKDPLVLNFSGTAAELGDTRFSFDLDGDGRSESLRTLASGSGYLVFDRDGDGKVKDGSELFGARSGDGFGELAALDDDGNGWIDENDAAWTKLGVWTKDAAGGDILRSLKDAGVGAIGLQHIDTPFSVKDDNNKLLAQIRSTGVFLKENGGVGTVQKIDLAV